MWEKSRLKKVIMHPRSIEEEWSSMFVLTVSKALSGCQSKSRHLSIHCALDE